MKLGKFLKTARAAANLSLREVASRSGTSFARLSEFETGAEVNMTIRTAARLADALGVSVADVANACARSLRAAGEIRAEPGAPADAREEIAQTPTQRAIDRLETERWDILNAYDGNASADGRRNERLAEVERKLADLRAAERIASEDTAAGDGSHG